MAAFLGAFVPSHAVWVEAFLSPNNLPPMITTLFPEVEEMVRLIVITEISAILQCIVTRVQKYFHNGIF